MWVPEPVAAACGPRVLTMDLVDGVVVADMRRHPADARAWKKALARALAVNALSVLDHSDT